MQLHSTPWEKKAEGLKKIRSDYENMQRRLNIALKKIELMAAEVRFSTTIRILFELSIIGIKDSTSEDTWPLGKALLSCNAS